MAERGDVALALEARLDFVHAARDVDREHQLQIDLEILRAGGHPRDAEQAGDERDASGQVKEAHGDIRREALEF